MTGAGETLIRRAGPADCAALARLGAATFCETFAHLYAPEDLQAFLLRAHTASAYAALLADPQVAIWIASRGPGGEPVAYAVAGRCKLPVKGLESTAGEVRQLYVLADQQGQQLGTRLLIEALLWLRAAGRSPVYVGVWSENAGAQRLYRRFGFEKIGEYGFPVGRQLDLEYILKCADPLAARKPPGEAH